MNDDASLSVVLVTLEQLLRQAATRQDHDQLNALLADDFVEYGYSGRVYSKGHIIDRLTAEAAVDTTVDAWGYQCVPLAPGVVQLRYCSAQRNAAGGLDRFAHRSSIWRVSAEGRWQMVFHQGTATTQKLLAERA